MPKQPQFESVAQYAKRHKISRIAALKRIYTGKVKAQKVGRAYIIPKS